MNDHIVVLITASSPDEARLIARALVKERLCACVNVVNSVRSYFWWEDEVQDEEEILLVCKSLVDRFSSIEKLVHEHHSYTVPEIIALPVVKGSSEYLDWVSTEIKKTNREEK